MPSRKKEARPRVWSPLFDAFVIVGMLLVTLLDSLGFRNAAFDLYDVIIDILYMS